MAVSKKEVLKTNISKTGISKKEIMKKEISNIAASNDVILEKIIIGKNIACLSPKEKVRYVLSLCSCVGLNPLTHPIQIIEFDGKEIPYFTKDATEQLRKMHNVSITSIETKVVGNICVATAFAETPDGRKDCSTGAVSLRGKDGGMLSGKPLSNAMMIAETKSKRRVTLSICGLGFMDESELEGLPGAKVVNISYPDQEDNEPKKIDLQEYIKPDSFEDLSLPFENIKNEIQNAANSIMLKEIYQEAKKINWRESGIMENIVGLLKEKKESFKENLKESVAVVQDCPEKTEEQNIIVDGETK